MTRSTSRARLGAAKIAAAALAISAFTATTAQAQVQLEFWDMIWGPPEYSETGKRIVEEFNAAHPGIQVEYRAVPWNNWYQTFQTAVSSGSAPDLSTGAGYQAVQLYELDAIAPLDDLVTAMKDDGEAAAFAPGTVDVLRFDDHYVALPWALDIRVWYYRPSMLEAAGLEVPTTWEEFRAAAKALTGDGRFGVVGSGDTGGSHVVFASIFNNGGGLFDAEGNLQLTGNPRNVEAVSWLADLVADGSVNPASAAFSNGDKIASYFKGDAAFVLDSPGLYKRDGAPADDIAILPPLTGPNGDKGTIFWVNNIMMYAQSEHPEETMQFMRWWSQNQLPLWTEGNTNQIPARSAFQDTVAADDERYQYILANYLPVGKTTATFYPGIFAALSDVEGEGVMQTMTQQIWQGVPADEVLAQAEARMKSILGR